MYSTDLEILKKLPGLNSTIDLQMSPGLENFFASAFKWEVHF